MAQNPAEIKETEPSIAATTGTFADPAMFVAVVLFFSLALFLWWTFDHSYPFWDGAAHVKDSMAYARLIQHPHIFKLTWIKQFLTVNFDYPLTVHAINGLIKAIMGFGRASDMVALLLYQLILIIAVYKLTYILIKDRVAAALASAFVCSYPLVAILSHVPLLDLGYLSFTALGLAGIAFFKKNPGWWPAVLMGVTLAFGATSKQIAVLFLIGPCIMLLLQALMGKQWQRVGQLALAAVFPAIGLLLWIVPNSKALTAWRNYYKNDSTLQGGIVSVFFDHLSHYLIGAVSMLSPWLLLLSVVAFVYLATKNRDKLQALSIPICSSVCGLTLISALALNRPEERYVVPLAITAAVLSGALLSDMFHGAKASRLAASLVVLCTIVQFILFNFTPYPLPASPGALQVLYAVAGHNPGQELAEPRPSPTPPGDKWGQEWAIAEIEKSCKGRKTNLNIMPSTTDLSVHTIDLVCIYAGTQIEPSTFRQFTLHGDMVRYDEPAIKYYEWYLLKTGYQGSTLASQPDKDNYKKITMYVENPSNFSLVGQRDLPDGSILKLYHRQ
jgi:4-amino-4-deoxy-L-arabinose transferase-like glycosyltransferase